MTLSVILLASGSSRRFGGNKLLYEFKGRPLFLYTLERYRRIGDQRIIVTCYPQIAAYASDFQVVPNPDSSLGISHSLQLGLMAAPESDAFLFGVCDQPHMKKSTVRQFISGYAGCEKGIGCCSYGGNPGNPVIFGRGYIPELMSLQGDCGGRQILKRHLSDVWYYEVEDPAELADIDTREALE